MAAPAQSPLRRWKRFFGAFASVDAAIEAAEPVLGSRREFRSARGDIVELLCNAADDDHAEQLCLVLDDVMAESLETLRLIPATPAVLATTDLAKSVGALRDHDSERVRVLARGIVTGWTASVLDVLDNAMEAMKRLDNLPQPKEEIGDQQPKKIDQRLADARATRPAKIPEMSAKKASGPAVDVVRSDHGAGLCYDEKMEAAKRKFNEGYREADDAKRQRKIQVVELPDMLKQKQKGMHRILRERSQARSCSSMVNKTFSVIHRA